MGGRLDGKVCVITGTAIFAERGRASRGAGPGRLRPGRRGDGRPAIYLQHRLVSHRLLPGFSHWTRSPAPRDGR
jgi:hypothetical protein